MTPLEWILVLRFLSLILLLLAIYFYCKIESPQILFIIEEESEPELEPTKTISETFQDILDSKSEVSEVSETLQEVEEIVKTPSPPPSPKEETKEFEDLVKPKKTATKRRK